MLTGMVIPYQKDGKFWSGTEAFIWMLKLTITRGNSILHDGKITKAPQGLSFLLCQAAGFVLLHPTKEYKTFGSALKQRY
ncbi:hypothetical protein O6P43_033987 [Quillaja saponaria]|uniref:Uncharacterized protein n=1 Tax=Quillaja saponaria TaxID=32244 RepID=A0AAD7KTE5_QUISA|nr:hypothetical protein O6P43_033987 [Quillaja saponaria]